MCDNENKIENKSKNIEIDSTEEKRNLLVLYYIDDYFCSATKDLFNDIFTGDNLKDVLYDIVLNEAVNALLKKYIVDHSDEKKVAE